MNKPFFIEGDVQLDPIEGQQDAWIVLKKLIYRDSLGKTWYVEPGTIVNGESIPRILWPLFGSPFSDERSRRAWVFHDSYYCYQIRPKNWVDWVYRDIMLFDGTPPWFAKCKYLVAKYLGRYKK